MLQNKVNYSELLSRRKFDSTTQIVPDKIYFTIEDGINDTAVIGTAGNFVSITGLPKARKSTIIGAMIASFLIQQPVYTFSLKIHKDKNKIAIFDTEQSEYDFKRNITAIERITGYTTSEVFTFLDAYLLREDDSNNILMLINEYLKNNSDTGIVIIDGLLDLIDNMNDEGASKRLIRTLKRWAKKHDILIITVLHLGKKDNSSIGHIGSASDRYAQSTLTVEKTKEGNTTITGKYLRSAKDFEQIEIMWSNDRKKYIQLKP
jgi:hypothetical protein